MKQLFLFIVLLVVVGIAGFMYRATVEAPLHGTNIASTTATGCTAEARICPDGTSVGRTGPECTFAACTLPNIELPQAQLAFKLPQGFVANPNALGSDATLLGAYEKRRIASSSSPANALVVRRYVIPVGKDGNAVMLENTMFESSGNQPTSMSEFKPVIINGKTYQMIVVERFEAIVHVVYYLPRGKDVLRFEALERDVLNWTDPALDVRTLQTVAALESLLATVQSN